MPTTSTRPFCCQDIADKHAQQRTAGKTSSVTAGDGPASGAPVAPIYPDAVVPVAPGVERRFRDLVKVIKSHPANNDAMSEALGIQGDEMSAPDFSLFKPVFTVEDPRGPALRRVAVAGQEPVPRHAGVAGGPRRRPRLRDAGV